MVSKCHATKRARKSQKSGRNPVKFFYAHTSLRSLLLRNLFLFVFVAKFIKLQAVGTATELSETKIIAQNVKEGISNTAAGKRSTKGQT